MARLPRALVANLVFNVLCCVYHKKYELPNKTMSKENRLVLEDFLFPGEIIKFQSGTVKTLDSHFVFYITDQRILLYRRRGVLFKKDRVVAERIEDIRTLHYDEKGILKKKGVLCIETISKKMEPIEGKVQDIKAIWQDLQKHLKEKNSIQT